MHFNFIHTKTILKIIVSFLAVVYIFLLLTGTIPSLSDPAVSHDTQVSSIISESSDWNIVFDPEELVYDGSERFDPMIGVTVTDEENIPVETEVFSTIQSVRGKNQKEILYTVTTPTGQSISSSRTLILKNYNGPSIQLAESLPSISEDNLNHLASYLSKADALKAFDGYDNDISSSVTCEWTHDTENPLTLHVTFQIENRFLDTAVAKADLSLQLKKPYLALSATTIKLARNAPFDPYYYVQIAMDSDGHLLPDTITITGHVDTSTSGTYTLSYTVSDSSGKSSSEKFLNVVVE